MIKIKKVTIIVFLLTTTTFQTGNNTNEDEHYQIKQLCIDEHNFKIQQNLSNYISMSFQRSTKNLGQGTFGTVKQISESDGRTFAIKKNKDIVREKLIEGQDLYMEIVALKKFGDVKTYPGFFEYIGCTYEQRRKEGTNSFLYTIYIVTESLAYNLGDDRNLFFYSNDELTRIYHYKKLFHDLKIFQDENYSHLDIKPQNIMFDSKTKTLKFIDYGFMRKYHENENTEYLTGTLQYMPPTYLNGNTRISYQRDVYALLLSIAAIEYGEEYIELDCNEVHDFSKNCFNKLLSNIYFGFYKVKYPNATKIGVNGGIDMYFKVNPVNVECYTISCVVLQNLKFDDGDCKTAEEILRGFDKVVEYEVGLQDKRKRILV